MGKRIEKLKEIFSKEKQVMTNGNKFNVYTNMETQTEIDLQSIRDAKNAQNAIGTLETMTSELREVCNELIHEKNLQPYFLLQYQANYFCGTCKFETEDLLLKSNIINVIRGAFMLGCAGLYKNGDKFEPVSITQLEYDIDGEIKSCKTLPLKLSLQKMNEYQMDMNKELKGWRTLNAEQCKNLAVFSWGTMGYSAWITIYPFVKLQHELLTMIIIHSFIFNKKWIYRLNNPATIKKEIKLFFDARNPFIVNLGNAGDIPNRFTTEDVVKTNQVNDLLDYYNKTIAAYYQILGRQINLDVKKERNVSNEVEASQENFDVVQSDWLLQFELFIGKLKELGANVEVKKENENEGGDENADEGDKEPDNRKD